MGARKVEKWEVYMKIHQLHKQGFKVSNIARNLDLCRTTVYKYLGRSPEELAIWMAATKTRKRKLDPYHELFLSWLKEHPDLSSSQVLDWLQERYESIQVGESTVRAYVAELRETYHIPKVKMKRDYEAIPDPPMGQQAQVDFGQTNQKTNTGKEKKLHFISFVLSHSRYKVVEWLDRPFTTRDVIRAHENAFSKLGGIPYELVYDQDHLIVVSENAGDLLLTAEFQSYRQQRNLNIHLCRKADPESKGKIENVVGFIKKNFAKHRVFHHIDTWNEQSELWLERTGNGKVHNTTKKRPVEVFALEKQHLRPISPAINVAQNDDSSIPRVVRKDNTVRYKANRYSVPLGTYTHQEKLVHLSLADDDRLIIREHPEGPVIAEHAIDHRRGQLIQDRQHKRDRTKGIDAYLTSIAEQFEEAEKAIAFLEQIRRLYPRYIRDQLQLISREMNKVHALIFNEALCVCLQKKLFSANDFRDVVQFLNKQYGDDRLKPTEAEIQPLHPINQSILKAKPEKRDMSEYVSILKGATG
jgi:transposase